MNSALRPTSSLRAVTGVGHSLHGIVDRRIGIDRRPDQPKHDNAAFRHVSVSDAGHNPVSGRVFGKSIHKNLWHGINIDKSLVRHCNPLCIKGKHPDISDTLVTSNYSCGAYSTVNTTAQRVVVVRVSDQSESV